jgi:hypothetical protein
MVDHARETDRAFDRIERGPIALGAVVGNVGLGGETPMDGGRLDRVFDITHDIERVVVDEDKVCCVAGCSWAVGDDCDHRIA